MKKLLRWFLKYYESLPTVDRYARHGRAINVVVQELTSVAASEKITPTDIRVSYIDDELDMNLQTLYHMTIGVINSDTGMVLDPYRSSSFFPGLFDKEFVISDNSVVMTEGFIDEVPMTKHIFDTEESSVIFVKRNQ